jgi:hypothetical protein
MSQHPNAILVHRLGVCLVIPERGDAYYVRASDGAIGRRRGTAVFWVVLVEGNLETIATEEVGADVLALDTAAEDMAATIASFREDG